MTDISGCVDVQLNALVLLVGRMGIWPHKISISHIRIVLLLGILAWHEITFDTWAYLS